MSSAHPGFENAAKSISERQGVSMDSARAILASGAHHASHSAIKHNKRLKRVPGVGKGMTADELQKFMDGLMIEVEGELRKMDAIQRAKTLTKFRQMTSVDELCKLAKSYPVDMDDQQDANVNLKDSILESTEDHRKGDEDDLEEKAEGVATDMKAGQDELKEAKANATKSDRPGNLKKSFADKLHQVVQTIQGTNTAGVTPGEANSNQMMGGGDTTGNVPTPPQKPKAHPAAAAAASAFKQHVRGKSDNTSTDSDGDNDGDQPKDDDRTPDKADQTGKAPPPDNKPSKPFK